MKKFISIIKYIIIALITGGIIATLGYLSKGFQDWDVKNWFNKNDTSEKSVNTLEEDGLAAIINEESQLSVKAISKGIDDNNRDYAIFSYQLLDENGQPATRKNNELTYSFSSLDRTTVADTLGCSYLDVEINRSDSTFKITKLESFSFPIYLNLRLNVTSNKTITNKIVIYCPEELPYSTYVNDSSIGAMYYDDFENNPFTVNSIKRIPNGSAYHNTITYDDFHNNIRIDHNYGLSENIIDGFMSSAAYKDYYCSLDLTFDDSVVNTNADFYIVFGINDESFNCDDVVSKGHPFLHVTNSGITWNDENWNNTYSESMATPLTILGQRSLFTFTVGTGDNNQWVAVNYGNNPLISHQMIGQCNGKFAIVFGLNNSVKVNVNNIAIDRTNGHYYPSPVFSEYLYNTEIVIYKHEINSASLFSKLVFFRTPLINTHVYKYSLIIDSDLAPYVSFTGHNPANGVYIIGGNYTNIDIPLGTYECCLEVSDYGYTSYNTFAIKVVDQH